MSTTELETSASAGAAEAAGQGETVQPEQQTAGDAHQQTDTDEGSDQSKDEGKGDGLTPEQRTIKKLEGRIARLTAKKGGAERESEMLRQQLAEVLKQGSQQGEGGEPGESRQLTESDVEQRATQKAREIAEQRLLGEKVGKVLKEGAKIEGFKEAVDALAEVVPFTDKRGRATPFIEAVFDADNPAAVLKHLGENPEVAEDLADLTPAQLGRRIAKLESSIASAKKSVSAAPRPLERVSGGTPGFAQPRSTEDLMNVLRGMR